MAKTSKRRTKAAKRRKTSTSKRQTKVTKLRKAFSHLQFIGTLITIAGAILGVAAYLFHGAIFSDRTQTAVTDYRTNIRPLVEFAGEFVIENHDEIKKNDPVLFSKLLLETLSKKPEMRAKIILAAETFDNIARCRASYLCKIDDYDIYKQPLRRFWFTFKPAIEEMRGAIVPRDFASSLEREAKRILAEDRKSGLLPGI